MMPGQARSDARQANVFERGIGPNALNLRKFCCQ